MFFGYTIVNSVENGKHVKNIDYGSIKEYWFDQYVNGGFTGDTFEGYIYVKIKNGKYLKFSYSM